MYCFMGSVANQSAQVWREKQQIKCRITITYDMDL